MILPHDRNCKLLISIVKVTLRFRPRVQTSARRLSLAAFNLLRDALAALFLNNALWFANFRLACALMPVMLLILLQLELLLVVLAIIRRTGGKSKVFLSIGDGIRHNTLEGWGEDTASVVSDWDRVATASGGDKVLFKRAAWIVPSGLGKMRFTLTGTTSNGCGEVHFICAGTTAIGHDEVHFARARTIPNERGKVRFTRTGTTPNGRGKGHLTRSSLRTLTSFSGSMLSQGCVTKMRCYAWGDMAMGFNGQWLENISIPGAATFKIGTIYTSTW